MGAPRGFNTQLLGCFAGIIMCGIEIVAVWHVACFGVLWPALWGKYVLGTAPQNISHVIIIGNRGYTGLISNWARAVRIRNEPHCGVSGVPARPPRARMSPFVVSRLPKTAGVPPGPPRVRMSPIGPPSGRMRQRFGKPPTTRVVAKLGFNWMGNGNGAADTEAELAEARRKPQTF